MTNAQTLFLHKLLDYAAKTGICSNWPNCKELKVCGDTMADQVCLMTWHGSLAIITSVLNHGKANTQSPIRAKTVHWVIFFRYYPIV